jgi:hypothetical protein
MIVTVTLNPSLDRTFATSGFAAGEVNRALCTRLDAGAGHQRRGCCTAAGSRRSRRLPGGRA